MGGNLYHGDDPVPMLPPTFKLRLVAVYFDSNSLISPVLKMTGLGEDLFSNIEQEETVSIE